MTFKLSTTPVPLIRRDQGTKWKVLRSSQGALGFTVIYCEMVMEDEPEGWWTERLALFGMWPHVCC